MVNDNLMSSMNDTLAEAMSTAQAQTPVLDVVLIGAGIMSSTLATMLQQLEPTWQIAMYERLEQVAQESSNGWNNAGTGHSALAEMNYTPQQTDGQIELSKAIRIAEQFQLSRQFWSYLVSHGLISEPSTFINTTDHVSLVFGLKDVTFLRQRYQALQEQPLFAGMEFSDDPEIIKQWLPLVMAGRNPNEPIAATRMKYGCDVNFGALTRQLVQRLTQSENFHLRLRHDVHQLHRGDDGHWHISVADLNNGGQPHTVRAKQVFIGAGGGSLTLLQKAGIEQAKQYGGFPVGGQFLVTDNPQLVKQHTVKAYGKAAIGAPPMSVPHLDHRVIDGKPLLLFGPFASFSSRFLKSSSLWDLFRSVHRKNLKPMVQVGLSNFDLVRYLFSQLRQSNADRLAALRQYCPQAQGDDWSLWQAGQRVQIIKRDPQTGRGKLQFGTELVFDDSHTLSALLGASPGASTATAIMLDLLQTCFPDSLQTPQWQSKLEEMFPSFGLSLNDHPELYAQQLAATARTLHLYHPDTTSDLGASIEELWQPSEESVASDKR